MAQLDYGSTTCSFDELTTEESKLEGRGAYTRECYQIAAEVLKEVLRFRRSPQQQRTCPPSCPICHKPQMNKVLTAVHLQKPIEFVLPAFPGKSPNHSKVFGPLPDMAEKLALHFLQRLCERIQEIYTPGAKIILCSDGRVFSDLVGMRESDVTDYQEGLAEIIDKAGLTNLSTFNLDEIHQIAAENDLQRFIIMRDRLMADFGRPVQELKQKIKRGSLPEANHDEVEANRLYCGITRFLLEDAAFPGQTKSRTTLQKESKAKAYEVIVRSQAWSDLIASQFPNAVRLSIHP